MTGALLLKLVASVLAVSAGAAAVLVVVLLATGVWAVVADEGRLALAVVAGSYLIANLVATAVTAYRHGLRYAPLLPVVFATLHLAYGSGFLVGLVRWYVLRRGRRPAESPALEAPLE
jgi:hypothetical protein